MRKAKDIIREQGFLLFDGAMGTYYASLPERDVNGPEQSVMNDPALIKRIHTEYLSAGADAIKTNTFALGRAYAEDTPFTDELLMENANAALEAAAPYDAVVFADLGPIPGDDDAVYSIFRHQAEIFLTLGIEHFLLETLPSPAGVTKFAAWLKQICPDAFLIVSFAAGPDGFTNEGHFGKSLLEAASADKNIDAAGFNCFSGPQHLRERLHGLKETENFISVMPNAGYPSALGRRIVYGGNPDYFAGVMADMLRLGVKIIGGCCGTTPAHIAALRKAADAAGPLSGHFSPAGTGGETRDVRPNPVREIFESGRKLIAVEYDPPRNDDLSAYMEGARAIQNSGADVITIADSPMGVPRMDSTLVACKLKRELGIEAVPHVACRDRNLNAIKSLLLGLAAEELRTVLLVTGDPVPVEARETVKSVFNCNSRKLAAYVCSLGVESVAAPFYIMGALNVNAANFSSELSLALDKEKNGVSCFLTQPVLSQEAEENFILARKTLQGKLLAGLYPVVSFKNACFMNNEIAGIRVSGEIVERYRGLDRAEAEALAVEICLAEAASLAPYADGFYVMTPFNRTALSGRIASLLKEKYGNRA